MDEDKELQYWEVWYPKAASTGLLLGRGLVDPVGQILVHAPPDVLTVEVSDQRGNRLAYGKDLLQTLDSPMCRLQRKGDRVTREDFWPGDEALGQLVLLPGGEVGSLLEWWNSPDQKEWRWKVEFYNTTR